MTIEEAAKRVTFQPGAKIRIFQGWYRHTVVMIDGQPIGRIQTRRKAGRFDTITLNMTDGAALGQCVPWLVREFISREKKGDV